MSTRVRICVASIAIGLMVVSCGGGDGDQGLGDEGSPSVTADAGGNQGGGDADTAASGQAGPPTHTADPGQAWAEVDGQRLEYMAADSQHYSCEVMSDRITINYQTADGHDLNLQASILDGNWVGNLTFKPGGGEVEVSYGATLGFDPGTLGIGDEAVSYEGTVSRVEDFDVVNAQETQATIAVNCAGG